MKNQNIRPYFLLLCSGILAIFLFSAKLGTVSVSWLEIKDLLLGQNSENLAGEILLKVRIPRFFLAFIAGGILATTGQAMQILVRNPLADPFTMGTASGAALGVNLAISGFLPSFLVVSFALPFYAFVGAFLSSFLVLALVYGNQNQDGGRFLLVGVAVSMLANSILSLLTYWAAKQNEVRHLLFWTLGNLDKASWETLLPISGMAMVGLAALLFGHKTWNLLLLGDEKAESLGLNVSLIKKLLLVLCSFLTACVVCLAGPIGFVGLVVPYWTRKVFPVTIFSFWPFTFFTGAVFLSGCDLLSRILFQPFGLPIGLVTSLVGLPFFLYLLRDSSQKTAF